jgi:hypothetical protein
MHSRAASRIRDNWLGVLAGFLITFAGLLMFAMGAGDRCSMDLLERSSYIGGLEVERPDSPAKSAEALDVENPYGLGPESCDAWTSPLARIISLAGMILIPLIGGAAATRIGHGDGVWRAVIATGLAGLAIATVSTRFTAGDAILKLLFSAAAFAALGALGAALATFLRRRFKSPTGAQ